MENTVKQGKIFVGGISWETTEETLKKHFSRYGEVVKSEIPKVWETGFGKGFGFVTFTDSSVFDKLLQDQHIILGRTVMHCTAFLFRFNLIISTCSVFFSRYI